MPIQGVTKKGKIRYTWCFFGCKVYVVWHLTFVVFSVDGSFFDEGEREIGKKRCSESIGNNDHDDNEPESEAQERMKSVNVDEEIADKPFVDSECLLKSASSQRQRRYRDTRCYTREERRNVMRESVGRK